jgi:hypothetical protein
MTESVPTEQKDEKAMADQRKQSNMVALNTWKCPICSTVNSDSQRCCQGKCKDCNGTGLKDGHSFTVKHPAYSGMTGVNLDNPKISTVTIRGSCQSCFAKEFDKKNKTWYHHGTGQCSYEREIPTIRRSDEHNLRKTEHDNAKNMTRINYRIIEKLDQQNDALLELAKAINKLVDKP